MTATRVRRCAPTLPRAERVTPIAAARGYFALQAIGGAIWWLAVFASRDVQRWTLGHWDPAALVVADLVLFVGASAVAAMSRSRRAATIAAAVAAVWTTVVTAALAFHGLADQAAGWGVVMMSLATLGTLAAAATMWLGHLPTSWFFVGPLSFRVAEAAPGERHLRRSLTQLVVFWTTFFVVIPLVLEFVEERLLLDSHVIDRPDVRLAGAMIFLLGSAFGLWACVTMALRGSGTPLPAATARDLVITGPYRWVRNPMALAGVLQTTAVGLMLGSWMVIAVAAAGATVWNVLIRPVEEADLAARFGDPYRRYAGRVRCWVPNRPSRC
jgi:protein-S-isoprenylcysteine O-methyltransferase Ste14